MLAVVTGPVRSGKSRVALDLALATGRRIVIAVGGRTDDEEMARRIARHQADRPADIEVVEADADPGWIAAIPDDACLLVDCLGTVLGSGLARIDLEDVIVADERAEEAGEAIGDALVSALLAREGDTVVVSNEAGWGVVPATPLGRMFRDVLGRITRRLVDSADTAWLVVAGRCIDLGDSQREARWPE